MIAHWWRLKNEAIVMCGDWEQSKGCKSELGQAKNWGLEVLYYEQVVK